VREFLTVEEAAKYLQVGEETVRRYIKRKKLPAEKYAGKFGVYLINKTDLLEFKIERLQKKMLPIFE